MRRILTAAGASLAVLTMAPLAMAQKADFGQQGEFILSADRLLPFFGFTSFSVDNGTGNGVSKNTTTITQSSLSFFYGGTPNFSGLFNGGGGGGGAGEFGANLFYTVPRLGFDYVVAPHFTVGGDVVLYFTLGGSTTNEIDDTNGNSNKTSTGNPGVALFGIAPRVGYILPLTDMFSFWPRGGLSYYTATAKQTTTDAAGNSTTNSATENQPAIDLDPQIVFTPIPHLGFTAGLTLDIPFAGKISNSTASGGTTDTASNNASALYFGLSLGMLGYF